MTSCVSSSIVTKRGDTFSLVCTYKQGGVPTSIDGYEITSQVRDISGTLIDNLIVQIENQVSTPGVFTLSAASTASWPVRNLLSDIQFVLDGDIRSTQTFCIAVQEDITRA
jgi:hypothetical protein